MSIADRNKLDLHLRWMTRPDFDEVLAIEDDSFRFPWSSEEWLAHLRTRSTIAMVAESGGSGGTYGKVVGVIVYRLQPNHLDLIRLAVDVDYRRRQVGAGLIRKLTSKLSPSKPRDKVVHTIRETNLPGQLFFRSQGFRAIEVLPKFFAQTNEDGYLMQFRK